MKFRALAQMQAKNLRAGKHSGGQGLWFVKRDRTLRLFMRLGPLRLEAIFQRDPETNSGIGKE